MFRVSLLILFFIPGNIYSAEKAGLTDIMVINSDTDLLLDLVVRNAFTPQMKQAVMSGVYTSFSFFINLHQVRSLWFDKKIVTIKLTHSIKYHNLKKEFIIERSWDGKSLTVKTFKAANQLMTHIKKFKVVSLQKLKKGRQYQIQTKAELSQMTLPYYLHYVLFFVSLWNFETDWFMIDFIY